MESSISVGEDPAVTLEELKLRIKGLVATRDAIVERSSSAEEALSVVTTATDPTTPPTTTTATSAVAIDEECHPMSELLEVQRDLTRLVDPFNTSVSSAVTSTAVTSTAENIVTGQETPVRKQGGNNERRVSWGNSISSTPVKLSRKSENTGVAGVLKLERELARVLQCLENERVETQVREKTQSTLVQTLMAERESAKLAEEKRQNVLMRFENDMAQTVATLARERNERTSSEREFEAALATAKQNELEIRHQLDTSMSRVFEMESARDSALRDVKICREEASRAISQSESALHIEVSKCESLTAEMESLSKCNYDLQRLLDSTKDRVVSISEELRVMEQAKAVAEANAEEARARILRVEAALRDARRENESTRNEITALREGTAEQLARLEGEYQRDIREELRVANDKATSELQLRDNQVLHLKQLLADHDNLVEVLRAEASDRENNTRRQFAAMKTELYNAERRIEQAESRLTHFSNSVEARDKRQLSEIERLVRHIFDRQHEAVTCAEALSQFLVSSTEQEDFRNLLAETKSAINFSLSSGTVSDREPRSDTIVQSRKNSVRNESDALPLHDVSVRRDGTNLLDAALDQSGVHIRNNLDNSSTTAQRNLHVSQSLVAASGGNVSLSRALDKYEMDNSCYKLDSRDDRGDTNLNKSAKNPDINNASTFGTAIENEDTLSKKNDHIYELSQQQLRSPPQLTRGSGLRSLDADGGVHSVSAPYLRGIGASNSGKDIYLPPTKLDNSGAVPTNTVGCVSGRQGRLDNRRNSITSPDPFFWQPSSEWDPATVGRNQRFHASRFPSKFCTTPQQMLPSPTLPPTPVRGSNEYSSSNQQPLQRSSSLSDLPEGLNTPMESPPKLVRQLPNAYPEMRSTEVSPSRAIFDDFRICEAPVTTSSVVNSTLVREEAPSSELTDTTTMENVQESDMNMSAEHLSEINAFLSHFSGNTSSSPQNTNPSTVDLPSAAEIFALLRQRQKKKENVLSSNENGSTSPPAASSSPLPKTANNPSNAVSLSTSKRRIHHNNSSVTPSKASTTVKSMPSWK